LYTAALNGGRVFGRWNAKAPGTRGKQLKEGGRREEGFGEVMGERKIAYAI
jgi:hypothetical protein